MNGHTLDTQLRAFSEIHGFLNHLFSHQFLYGGGDLLEKVVGGLVVPQIPLMILTMAFLNYLNRFCQ